MRLSHSFATLRLCQRHNYRVGVPWGGVGRKALNSDSEYYGGSGIGNLGKVTADEMESHGRPFSLNLMLPPLATVILTGKKI